MPRDNPEYQKTYSQTQEYGMVPVYGETKGKEKGAFLGYEFNPIAAGLKREDAPKPLGVLAEEKRLGTTMEPIYATFSPEEKGGGERGGLTSGQYGPPIGYRYDNGSSQYVNFDANGQYVNTQNRNNNNDLLKALAFGAGAMFLGPAVASLFGEGAITAGAAEGLAGAGAAGSALTPAAIESLAGTAGYGVNASALQAAAAAGIPVSAVGANALSQIPGATTSAVFNPASTATQLGDIANLTTPNVGVMGSANQAVASGMAPGSVGAASAAGGALSPAELAAASGTTTLGNIAAPAAISANQAVASGMSPGSAGATAAAAGGLTAAEQAAAQGVSTAGSTTADLTAGAASALANNPSLIKQLQDATGLTGTQLAALLSGGVNAATAANTSSAIGAGLKAQQDATKASQDVLKGVYNQQLGFQQPYQGAGVNAINQLGQLGSGQFQQYDPVTGQPTTMGAGSGYLSHQFNAADLAGGLAPNYDFMLQQGQMANQRAANVGGGALSGNTLQGLQKYTQDYAGNAYQNAFQNYQTQRNNIYKNLSDMAGIGQTANQQAGTAGQAYGTGITGLNTGLANATAAAMLGQAQAAGGGANSLANSTFLAALLGQKTPT